MLVACSGGPDSTALAVLLTHVRPDLRSVLAYVAHGLRGHGTDEVEQAQVAALAEDLGVEHVVLPVTVLHRGAGIESDARDARHAALEGEARRCSAVAVVLGHHADDQAETLLLRIARGTGVDGLAGMAPVAGLRVRPLLDVRRRDVHRVAEDVRPGALGRATHDPMNDDAAYARVRVRDDVLPMLERVGPDVVGALTRLAAIARDESAVLQATVAELVTSLPVVSVGAAVVIPSAALRALPVGLARRVLRVALGAHDPDGARTRHQPDAAVIERLLRAPDGRRVTLPGPLDAEVDRGWHIVVPAPAPAPVSAADSARGDGARPAQPLDEALPLQHDASGMRISLSRDPDGAARAAASGTVTLIALPSGGAVPGLVIDRLHVRLRDAGALLVRTRRDGDRVRTPGGTRSVSDVMAEAGVPRALRDLLPVLVDEDDRVRWVPGLVVDEAVHERIDDRSDLRPDDGAV